ncbi:MAG: succinate dehydrogenase assembly factor 2 [Tropicimonas sp.]|uniref:succinate dehydrogenase assembly factor 2 n=1 Tax=Tropicimonas sp. TaxID=2067044 RepID=UPI003A86F2ED
MSVETRENRLKRLHIRSWRRGIKEMDLVLGHYSDDMLAGMTGEELDLYEALLGEMDQDLLSWITGQEPEPEHYSALFARLRDHARARGFAQ